MPTPTRPTVVINCCATCTWFERVSILVILLNCITLGMYQPCVDDDCVTNRCKVLQVSRCSTITHTPMRLVLSDHRF